jgi:hypothetical protein
MRPHFARLSDAKKAGEVTVPPAWIIDQIRKRKPLEERPQPRVEIDEYPPPGWKRPERRGEEQERGVCIIDFSV